MARGKDRPNEDRRAPLLTDRAKGAAATAAMARQEADQGVGRAILGLRAANDDRRANML